MTRQQKIRALRLFFGACFTLVFSGGASSLLAQSNPPKNQKEAPLESAIPAPGAFRSVKRASLIPEQSSEVSAASRPLPVTSAKAESLHPEFQVGYTYRFVFRSELETLGSQRFILELQARYDGKVRLDGKPGVTLIARIERLDLTMSSGGALLSYSSMTPADQTTPLGRHLRVCWKVPVELLLSPEGKVDEVRAKIDENSSNLLPDVPRFGPDELVQLVTSLTQVFPKQKVSVGREWNIQGARKVNEAGSVEFALTCRYMDMVRFEDQNCARIEFSGSGSGELPRNTPDNEVFQVSEMGGGIYFDPLDRMVRSAETHMVIRLGYPPANEGEVDHRQLIRETSKVRLLHIIPSV